MSDFERVLESDWPNSGRMLEITLCEHEDDMIEIALYSSDQKRRNFHLHEVGVEVLIEDLEQALAELRRVRDEREKGMYIRDILRGGE